MLPSRHAILTKRLALSAGVMVVVACLAFFAGPPAYNAAQHWLGMRTDASATSSNDAPKKVELVRAADGHLGLRLSPIAIANLDLRPVAAQPAVGVRPLPPQVGTLNYDSDALFTIRPRFAGEVVELDVVHDPGEPKYVPGRPLRFGDKVKQGDLLAVVWSKDLGEKKASYIDALVNLKTSEQTLQRQTQAFNEGALPLATLQATERQVRTDRNAVLTAERTLKLWRLTEKEIDEVRQEADVILKKGKRDADYELKWARVEIRVPQFGPDPNRELVVLEKNVNLHELVDPGRDTPLFRLGDLNRLQIWVHPAEEYLPLLRDRLARPELGPLTWDIRFQAEPAQSQVLEKLPIAMMSPSLEPNQHTPMLIGYLRNPERRYLVGQFVTATIYVPPPENTTQIPTDAVNYYEGQNLVFVQKSKDTVVLRRVAVVSSAQDVTLVRSKLTEEDKRASAADVKKGRYPIEPLAPEERVITRGVVELTAALEELATNEKIGDASPE